MRKFLFYTCICATPFCSCVIAETPQPPIESPSLAKPFVAKDYANLIGMPGFSNDALSMHFKLYQGYVKTTNAFLSKLEELRKSGNEFSLEFAEFKRRLMWDFDGMRLHEDYFDNLGGYGTSLDPKSALYQQMVVDFGSYDAWKSDFVATGAMRGIGWAILYRDPLSGRLINTWINEHDRGHLAGGNPILVMDVFEHAYLLDYGLDRKAYIDAFFNNINWPVVQTRYPGGNNGG
ncbi:MAG: superoxide dismutase [Chlamydiales bacterium]